MDFGMSDALGPVSYEGHAAARSSTRHGASAAPQRGDGPRDRRRGETDRRRERTEARRILREHRDVLESVFRRLLEKEVIEGEELRELMVVHPESSPAPVVS